MGRGSGCRGPDEMHGVHKGALVQESVRGGGNVSLTLQRPNLSLMLPRWAEETPEREKDMLSLTKKKVVSLL